MTGEIIFVLGDYLPTYYEAGIAIYSQATKPKSPKMDIAIKAYAKSLTTAWENSFGEKHVLSRSNVVNKLEKLVDHYYNNVYNIWHRDSKKHQTDKKFSSIRCINKLWRFKTIDFGPLNNKKLFSIDSLLDIGRDTCKLTGAEKWFYEDQQNERRHRLSEDIDDEWVAEQAYLAEQAKLQQEHQLELVEDNFTDTEEVNDLDLNVSCTRSGKRRVLTDDQFTQTEEIIIPKVKIRNNKNCTTAIKSTCVQVSVNCGISAEMSTVAVQTFFKGILDQDVYLTKEEAISKDPSLAAYRKTEESVAPMKRRKLEASLKGKTPVTKDDYLPYRNVLPSPKTINDYKQLSAVQEESDAASCLYHMPSNINCTLHYDTTSRCKIDGEWPAIIFSFANGKRFTLRPLFFAYEDRSQIVLLLAETYRRLAVCITFTLSADISVSDVAKQLWEKTTVIMTDSVEKNLKIEDGIADALGSSYKPIHTLCKAHTVEALDRSNIAVLAKMENKIKLRQAFESLNPSVKSFLRGEKSVAISAIKSVLNFVSHDKSATSTNQADLFDYVLQREKKIKHMSLFQERRFTKLGYSCASILDALPFIRMVLNETHLCNQHTEIVQMFLDSELLLSELGALAYFTYKVSFPLLYAIEISTQDDLCQILPKLHMDLLTGSLDTLNAYVIEHRHMKIKAPSTELEEELVTQMCFDAAKVIELQCGREYGFGKMSNISANIRATQIHKLPVDQRRQMCITSNIPAERNLAIFDKRCTVAKYRNYKFKAKTIRNAMVLHGSSFQNTPNKILKVVAANLDKREKVWTDQQMILHKQKIEEKIRLAEKQGQYTNKLLTQCKSWNGPITSVEELNVILKGKPNAEEIVKTELTYYRNTHRSEVIASPNLFKLNKVSHEERLTNLCILLGGMSNTVTRLPDNRDALSALRENSEGGCDEELSILQVNDTCVTLWLEGSTKQWYIGYCKEVNDNGTFEVDHIHRVKSNSNLIWKFPFRSDLCNVHPEQVLKCDVVGEWDCSNDRNMTFTLKNHEIIDSMFADL